MSLEPDFELKHTNVSRPHLSHTNSLQSIAASQAASEGYYSLSDHTNSSSETDAPQPSRFYTPPSHHRTPTQSHEHLQHNNHQPITSLRGFGLPRQQHQTNIADRPVSTIAEERPETRSQRLSGMESESLATTPGQDNTPYIRFAIDQLTRDEEVRGSRMYPLGRESQHEPQYEPVEESDESESEDYPVERIVSDDSLGYMRQQERTHQRLSQYQPPPPPQKQQRLSQHVLTHNAKPSTQIYQNYAPQTAQEGKDLFVAREKSNTTLDFLPAILRPLWLGLFTFLCVLMLGALIFCAVYSNRDNGLGLWDYRSFGDIRYFVFEYLPTLLGAIIYLWLIQLQTALQRVVPLISMRSDRTNKRSEAIFLQLYPMQFLFPRLEYFRAGQPMIGVCFVVFWLFSWTIPLLASAFNVRYNDAMGAWRWVAVQGVIWTIIALYLILVVALLMVFMFLSTKTGLKWDPRSLADIITLLERSNIVDYYEGSETFEKKDWDALRHRDAKIGFWSTTKQPEALFHGFGEEGAPARTFEIADGRIKENSASSPGHKNRSSGDFRIRTDIRNETVRLRHLPWYLKDTWVLAWMIIAFFLYIAFLVISFVKSNVRDGFLPQLTAVTNPDGFSASNFLFSFIPALIAHILFLVILTFDYTFRTLRPYISLSTKSGATAESSLLVDYSSRYPFSAAFAALENSHYQNAMLSTVSFFSAALPILAGGCFWSQWYPRDQVVRVAADMPGFIALVIFLSLYALSLAALWPNRRRAALPHASTTIAEITSWLYQSPILADRAFSRPNTKPELVARLMGSAYLERSWAHSLTSLLRPSRDNLRTAEPMATSTEKSFDHSPRSANGGVDPWEIRYGFGIFVGRDRLEHLGIDRVKGRERGRELVIWEEQNEKSKKGGKSGRGSWGGSAV